MNLSEGIFKILVMDPDRNFYRNKIHDKSSGKNLIFDRDIHCNQQ